jgi:predicted SAM-dependent methyltransferase
MDEIKLNLGCGKNTLTGWVNIDSKIFPGVDYHDVTVLGYKEHSVNVIYASHLIAYFDRHEIIPVLKEWYRVLRPSVGKLVISTPDWDVLRNIPRPLIGPLYGKMNEPSIYHKTVYNYDELYQVLRSAGFINIQRSPHNEYEFDDQSRATYDGQFISLTVTCNKL